jgi:hypothetical protein
MINNSEKFSAAESWIVALESYGDLKVAWVARWRAAWEAPE